MKPGPDFTYISIHICGRLDGSLVADLVRFSTLEELENRASSTAPTLYVCTAPHSSADAKTDVGMMTSDRPWRADEGASVHFTHVAEIVGRHRAHDRVATEPDQEYQEFAADASN
ncbi:hypothetical protein CERSUDRAFT_98841 [Gelatoporia subvermispora B]|uniref:Uncharacterized protein n=1 Tax=Ceriporiopsis subvermispora (strain B) TaxID=914234 RepID=M2R2X0_CERS8|nr:hypothetical protein CERSUDRAFT_98841 [Gelatoporia subvermispora B]